MPVAEMEQRRRVALVAALGVLALAIMGAFLFRGRAARSPELFQQRVQALAKDLVRDRWDGMRQAVELVGTDDGARAFYRASPGLVPRVPDEEAFLRLCRPWRRLLQPLPEAIPDPASRDLGYEKTEAGTLLSYREPNGTRIWMRWNTDGQLTEMRVY